MMFGTLSKSLTPTQRIDPKSPSINRGDYPKRIGNVFRNNLHTLSEWTDTPVYWRGFFFVLYQIIYQICCKIGATALRCAEIWHIILHKIDYMIINHIADSWGLWIILWITYRSRSCVLVRGE